MELLERETQLAVMENALHQASEAAGQMLLISGEAGIGKSSLVTHFVQSQQTIHRVLWGSCDDLFTPRPLGPLHDIARQVGGQLLELLRSPQERSLLLNAVLNQLQSPVIVVFEDIHWADEATLDLLKFLGRRMTRTQALLLITFRDDELDQRHPLYLLLGDLNRQSTTRRLRLAPLSVTAVEQLSSGFGVDAGRLHQEPGAIHFICGKFWQQKRMAFQHRSGRLC